MSENASANGNSPNVNQAVFGPRDQIKQLLAQLEPMVHEVYGKTAMLHDVTVITKFVEFSMWLNLADRNQAQMDAFQKEVEKIKADEEAKKAEAQAIADSEQVETNESSEDATSLQEDYPMLEDEQAFEGANEEETQNEG